MSMRDVKVCLLGDSGVGKSSIVMRFVTDKFKQALESTVGASFMTKTIVVKDSTYKFQIWDTAGQEKYRSLAPMYYRGSAAAIIVYDVTREGSFAAVKSWVHELQRIGPQNIVIAIAGNKSDLADLREVPEKDAQEYAKEIEAIFCETSALTATNIPELFNAIALHLPTEDLTGRPNSYNNSTVNLGEGSGKQRKGCCSSGGGSSSASSSSSSSASNVNNSSSSSRRGKRSSNNNSNHRQQNSQQATSSSSNITSSSSFLTTSDRYVS